MDENIGYNGAYTGSQIDAAIGAVRDKETTWDGKQDKLTGVQGQVVGFDDEGDAVAMPAPDTGVTTFNGRTGAVTPQAGDYTAAMVGARGDDWMPTADDVGAIPAPEGGTAGQLLTKTASGTEWADAPSGLPDGATEGQMLYQGATGPEWGIPPYLESVPQLSSAQMKSLHALGITDLNDVTEPGTYVGMGYGSTNYPTISNVPSEVGMSPFILNLYLLIAPTDSDFSGNNVAIQVCFGLLPVMNHKAKTWYRTAQLTSINTEAYWSGWSLAASIASSTEFVPTSPLTSDNVQDAIEEVQGNIPTNYVPTSRTVNNKELSANITLGASDVGARPSNWTPTAADVGAVPTNRTVNGKALSANITLNASDVGAATEADVEGAKPMLRTATLTTSGWSSNSQTVTVNGVVANSSAQLIYVSPANKDSATAWGAAGVFCSAQGANSLTFVCDSTPSANITVNISIQEAQT